jgi:hypothetical protein
MGRVLSSATYRSLVSGNLLKFDTAGDPPLFAELGPLLTAT